MTNERLLQLEQSFSKKSKRAEEAYMDSGIYQYRWHWELYDDILELIHLAMEKESQEGRNAVFLVRQFKGIVNTINQLQNGPERDKAIKELLITISICNL